MDSLLKGLKFDPRTALITLVLAPLGIYLARMLLAHLKKLGGYVLEGILEQSSRVVTQSAAGRLTLRRYCRVQLGGATQYLSVPSRVDVLLEIDRAYVPLVLEGQGTKQLSYTHSDVIAAGNRIRVIGDPGSGKSTLVKRLFRDACSGGKRKPGKSRLPVIVELKNLEVTGKASGGDLGQWFYEYLRSTVGKVDAYRIQECFDAYAHGSGILVLLDGLDEVSTTHYPIVQDAINALSRRLDELGDKNVVVLTSRTQFHQQTRDNYADRFPVVLSLKPFTPTDIYEFLTRWPFGKNREQNASKVYKDLTDRPTLREMCSNPLVLAMYVAEDQASDASIPHDTRTEFYSLVTEELIVRRRQRQTGPAVAPGKLREQRQRILGRLAYEHLLDAAQPANTLDWSAAILVCRDILGCGAQPAEQAFRDLAKETGLITEERIGESFRFIHLTFCEFLAAFEAVQGQEAGWSRLVEAHSSFREKPELGTRLFEVVPFACGLMPRVKRQGAISDVYALGDGQLLALCFLETKAYEHPRWPSFVEGERRSLLDTPEEEWGSSWLRRLHTFNVVVRDASRSGLYVPTVARPVDLAAFFQELVSRQADSLATLLSAYASQDAAAAFRLAEVCNLDLGRDFPEVVVTSCDQPPFLALVRGQLLGDLPRVGLWASLLSEAALRSAVVAKSLQDAPPAIELNPLMREIPRKERWWGGPVVGESLYTQLLTLGVYSDSECGAALSLLGLVRRLPCPGAYGARSALYRASAVLLPLVYFASFVIPTPGGGRAASINRVAAVASGVLLLLLLWWVSRRGYLLSAVYDLVLQRPFRSSIFRIVGRLFLVLPASPFGVLGRKYGDTIREILETRGW
jgi:hypothetical protein